MNAMRAGHARRQEGVVLMIALIVLVAMTLAGIGIVRSVDTGTIVAGNIGLRQAAVATADSGVEAARVWLLANSTALDADNPSAGYYSTRQTNLDLTGNRGTGLNINWGGSNPSATVQAFTAGSVDASGNSVYYVIHRLCSLPGNKNLAGQDCAFSTVTGVGSTQGAITADAYGLPTDTQIYYRITVRVNGPKNTVSYVQAMILI